MPVRSLLSTSVLSLFLAAGASSPGWAQAEPSPVPAPAPAPAPTVPAAPPVAEPPLKPAEEVLPGPATEPVEPPPANPGIRNMWRYIVIHHSASPSGNAAAFERLHRAKGWDGLAYHFVITNGKGGPDGGLEVGQRWWKQKHGAHAGALHGLVGDERNEYNEFGIGICLVGNFEKRPPSRAQLKTLARLVAKLQEQCGLGDDAIVGHRHVTSTACPGRCFPWKTLFAMMDRPAPALYRRYPVATTEHCPWCDGADVVASRGARFQVIRNDAAGREGISSELPPTVSLVR